MRTTKKTEPQAEATPKTPADVIASDEFAGKGGSYIFDPKTGTRSPAHQPEETTIPTGKE